MTEDKHKADREEALAMAALPEKKAQTVLIVGDDIPVDHDLILTLLNTVRDEFTDAGSSDNERMTFAVTFLLTEIVAIEKDAGERIDAQALFEHLKKQLEAVRKELGGP